jgi:predicted enzyme related to lactoylglutathione lyase
MDPMTNFNGIAWFEIGTDKPAEAEAFYGRVFGWTVAHDDSKSTDPAYQIFSTGGDGLAAGALFNTKAAMPSYAVFTILVEDVEATCRDVGVAFAHLLDPAGNHFAVFTPPVSAG